MKTRNLIIYHCLFCGKVVHADTDADSPQCCGREMVNALADPIHDCESDFSIPTSAPRRIMMPPVNRCWPRPR
jgi:hypothetical protein